MVVVFFRVKDGGIRLKEWSLIVMCVFLDFFYEIIVVEILGGEF